MMLAMRVESPRAVMVRIVGVFVSEVAARGAEMWREDLPYHVGRTESLEVVCWMTC